jgi:hypothetical protein
MARTIEKRLALAILRRSNAETQARQERTASDYDSSLEAAFLLSDLRDFPEDQWRFRALPDWIQAELLRFEMGVEAAQRAGVWRWDQNPPVLNHFAYALSQLLAWYNAQPGHVSKAAVELPDASEWEQFDWSSGEFADEWKLRYPLDTEDRQRFTAWRRASAAPPQKTTNKCVPAQPRPKKPQINGEIGLNGSLWFPSLNSGRG